MKTPLLSLACAIASTSVLSAATSIWTFENYTAGSAPSGADVLLYNANGTSPHSVVVSNSPTPFGAGNLSLLVNRVASADGVTGSSNHPSVQLALASTPLAEGTISFDLYVQGTGANPGLIEINLGALSTGSGSKRGDSLVTLQIWTNSESTGGGSPQAPGRFLSFSDGTSGTTNLYAFNERVTIDAKNTISISWSAISGTYSVQLNGTTVTRGSGGGLAEVFNATTNQAGVSALRFTTANGSAAAFYVDNIQFGASPIPEPSSAALLLGAAAGVAGLTKRRTGQR